VDVTLRLQGQLKEALKVAGKVPLPLKKEFFLIRRNGAQS
jgi:hypothetical protein